MTPPDPAPPSPDEEIRRTLSGPDWDSSRERAATESAAYFAANPPSPLEALLKEVEELTRWRESSPITLFHLAPRLAAIVRVLREALRAIEGSRGEVPEYYTSATALRRADEIAEGKA